MLQSHMNTTDDLSAVQAKIDLALAHLKTLDLANLPVGRYEIDADKIFFMIDDFETVPAELMRFEAHRKYLDIQGVISGHEAIQVARTSFLTVDSPYDETKDIAFFRDIKDYSTVTLGADDYVVLMPEDAHKPKVMLNQPEKTKKFVVKIRI